MFRDATQRRGRMLALATLAVTVMMLGVAVSAQGGVRYYAGTLVTGQDYINPSTVNPIRNTRAWTTGAHICTGVAGVGVFCSGQANEITINYGTSPPMIGRPRCKSIDNITVTAHCWYNY